MMLDVNAEWTVYAVIYDLMLHVKDFWASINLRDLGFTQNSDYTLAVFFFACFGAGSAFSAMYSKWRKNKE